MCVDVHCAVATDPHAAEREFMVGLLSQGK
jgi:hypothetical protein